MMCMPKPHAVLRVFRLLHLYIGVFIAPALLFFALTGALQTFSLHESTPGSSYKPKAWIVTLAQIHKKQTPVAPQRRQPPPAAAPSPAGDHHGHADTAAAPAQPAAAPTPAQAIAKAHNPLPLKIFFLLVSIGLFLSTISGLYMTWKYVRNRVVMAVLLIAGIVTPVALVLI